MHNISYREQLFLHIDGVTALPILQNFQKLGIIDYLLTNSLLSEKEISEKFKLNEAYLSVCLRSLLIADILKVERLEGQEGYSLNHNTFKHVRNLNKELDFIIELMPFYANANISLFCDKLNEFNLKLENLIINYKKIRTELYNNNNTLFYYFEGAILGPLLAYLGFYKMIDRNKDLSTYNLSDNIKNILIETSLYKSNFNITEKGEFFINRLSAYGVTVSYLSTFNRISNLLKNNYEFIWKRKNGYELHVHRDLNVWGSGGAHKYYFEKIDNIIINTFNKNIDEQPKGIIDIGCGDGTFLKHVYDVILKNTIRGKNIKQYPVKLIGVDINKAARIISRKTLNSHNIDNIIINGNISDPESLSNELKNNFGENVKNFLSCRTFLDHNRIFKYPKNIEYNNIFTSGAFCYKGKKINNNELINNLIEHLRNWKNHTGKFGLIILELHTIEPLLSNKNRGKTLACAYDTTHGLSDQYLVEYEVFINCAKIAGFKLDEFNKHLFPNDSIPTISISRFV